LLPEQSAGKIFRKTHGASVGFEARWLKFGLKNHLINAMKLTNKIFEFLSWSKNNSA